MLSTRYEVKAFLDRATRVRQSRQVWFNDGIVNGALEVLAKDIDRDLPRLRAAALKYGSFYHPEAAALSAELSELTTVRQILFTPPEV